MLIGRKNEELKVNSENTKKHSARRNELKSSLLELTGVQINDEQSRAGVRGQGSFKGKHTASSSSDTATLVSL